MNNIELVYKDDEIEVIKVSNIFNKEYRLMKDYKILMSIYCDDFDYVYIAVFKINYEYLKKFREVSLEHHLSGQ